MLPLVYLEGSMVKMDAPCWAYDRKMTDAWGLTSIPETVILPRVAKNPEFPQVCKGIVPRSPLSSCSGVKFVKKERIEGS